MPEFHVYLPVLVPVDSEGHLTGEPYVDWDAQPWDDSTPNTWDDEAGTWEKMNEIEVAAISLLAAWLNTNKKEEICHDPH